MFLFKESDIGISQVFFKGAMARMQKCPIFNLVTKKLEICFVFSKAAGLKHRSLVAGHCRDL